MRRVLTNLIDNAIAAIRERAASEGGAGARAASCVRTVHDAPLRHRAPRGRGRRHRHPPRGPPPHLRAVLLDARSHGTGLGLAIVSRIVADHHGYVRVHANRPAGRPLHRRAAPAELVREARRAVNRILIVDDEASIRRSLAGILSDEGFAPAEAAGRRGGPRRAARRERRPTSCCSTSRCPAATASRCSRRCSAAWPSLPVVMMSGHGTIETAVRATQLGAFDFLEKPLSVEKLLLTHPPRARARAPRAREPAAARRGGARPRDPRRVGGRSRS